MYRSGSAAGRHCLAITPARDEERLLPGLIVSMAAQTIRPDRWIIIDDGSVDRTSIIADEAAARCSWIEVHHLDRRHDRAPGGESVIMKFLPRELWSAYDFILRLDADLTFGLQMVELLMAEFDKDPRLGIAGSVLYEPSGSGWREIKMPRFHTRGAVKMYSTKCFDAIGGLQAGIGWDTLDEAQAMMLGFKTQSFRHIIAQHHRPQGAAAGLLRGTMGSGRTAYVIGYSPLFMLARAAHRVIGNPPIVGSVLLLAGYLEGYLRGLPRIESPELVKFIRREQRRRLLMMESLWH
jgi:poly-beta-1,6-N-acetyl-D-glucosamine synthase